MLSEHLRACEHQISRGDAFLQCASQLESHDFRDEHRHRLTKHRRFGLDPPNAPAEDAKSIDHCRMAVRPDAGIRIGDRRAACIARCPDCLGNVFKIDLVADAGPRRNGLEIVEALRAPFQKVVTLPIAVILDLDILLESFRVAKLVDHDRMVDDKMHGHERIDLRRVTSQLGNRIAHCCQIDHARDPGEILQKDACGTILDFGIRGGILLPVDQSLDVARRDSKSAILEPQQIFEQDLHGKR